MEESAKIGTAVEHSRNNKYFVEFVEYQTKLIEKNPEKYKDVNPEDDVLFLSYMTKKYFKDNIWSNLLKIIIGIAVFVVALILFRKGGSSATNILSIALFIFTIFAVPASIFFFFSNLSCYKHYQDYVTGRDDPFMDKICKYYDDAEIKK